MKRLALLLLTAMTTALTATGAAQAATPTATLRIDTAQPGPVIHRHQYSQFVEHLGRGVYDGLWVGPDSPIPNTRGWRNDVVAVLKRLKVPLMRWPGGCFADEYHWRDGIGPAAQRPVRLNKLWGGVVETNAVGTHEFLDLAEQLGAQVYINGNLGSGTVQEMADWLEYLTSDSPSTLANERRRNGRDKPFAISHFAVGNEAWGCGGHMEPETYAALYRQYSTFLRAPNRPQLIASGGNDADTRWTDVLSRTIRHNVDAIAHHYYTFPSGKFNGKGAATGFGEAEWLSTLANAHHLGALIDKNLEVLDRNDPQGKLAFIVDEWGTWYDDDPALKGQGLLYQHNTLRDALVAGLHFNLFHQRAKRVKMTNIAQMVNVLQAMVLTGPQGITLTPTFHAFEMHVPFHDATLLTSTVSGNPEYRLGEHALPMLSTSAARAADGRLLLSIVNSHARDAATLEVQLQGPGAGVRRAVGQLLSAATLDARNEPGRPAQVAPVPFEAVADSAGVLRLAVPAHALLVLALQP